MMHARIFLALLGILLLACAGIYFMVVRPGDVDTLPNTSSTIGTTSTSSSNVLPPEPAFELPEGAVAVSDYAFVADNVVYLRSVKTSASFAVPDSDASTFKSLSSFETYSTPEVLETCGGAGQYTFYGDVKHLYFYQVWRTPTFRSSQIEVVAGSDSNKFKSLGDHRYTDGTDTFTLQFKMSGGVCVYFLQRITGAK